MLNALHSAFRSLSRTPGHTAAALLTMALGLAAGLGAMAPAWDLLAFPFDFREPGRVVQLSGEGKEGAAFPRPIPLVDLEVLRRELKTVEALGGVRDESLELHGPGGPEEVRTALATADLFPTLGLDVRLGRAFSAEEARPGGPQVLVLTHGFWQRHFGGDPTVVGRTMLLGGRDWQILGVLAPRKHLPWFMEEVIAFRPLRSPNPEPRIPCWAYVRLAKGRTLGELQGELDRLSPQLGPPRLAGDGSWGLKGYGLVAFFRARVAPRLALALAAGALVLLLACANVAHLSLARHLDRLREWGVRAALGAGLRQLGSPLLAEALLLCLGGLLLAFPTLRLLATAGFLESRLPGLVPALMVLLLVLALTTLLPLRWARRLDLSASLKEGAAASASKASNRLRGGLTTLQLALAFALLVAAGLSLRAMERFEKLDPGFDLRQLHAAVFRLEMRPGEDFLARSAAFQAQVARQARSLPGATAAAMASTRALVDQGHDTELWGDGGTGLIQVGDHAIDPDYLAALGLPLMAGRNLEPGDRDACLVSAELARRCWGTASPLGRTLRLHRVDAPPRTVVGVVGEARMARLGHAPLPAVYSPLANSGTGYLTLYLRTTQPLGDLRTTLARLGGEADTGARLVEIDRLEDLAKGEAEGPRTRRRQTLAAGLLAAFLAGVGLMGTLGQMVSRQQREWGIRAALGAGPYTLARALLGRTAALLGMGVLLGLALAWVFGRLMGGWLAGFGELDPGLLLQAILLLGASALLANLLPLARLLRTPPALSLRAE